MAPRRRQMAKQVVGEVKRYNASHSRTETHQIVRCDCCGNETFPKGKPGCKRVKLSLQQSCKVCEPIVQHQHGSNWWSKFGLHKNPYVYGPMPWKRTGEFWRRVEAREAGTCCWNWTENPYKVIQG